jgi:hypothetical protein
MKKIKSKTQLELILTHLLDGNTLTQRSALMDFAVMALPRRIADLKERGIEISTVMEENSLTGQRYARYFMRRASINRAKKLLSA